MQSSSDEEEDMCEGDPQFDFLRESCALAKRLEARLTCETDVSVAELDKSRSPKDGVYMNKDTSSIFPHAGAKPILTLMCSNVIGKFQRDINAENKCFLDVAHAYNFEFDYFLTSINDCGKKKRLSGIHNSGGQHREGGRAPRPDDEKVSRTNQQLIACHVSLLLLWGVRGGRSPFFVCLASS